MLVCGMEAVMMPVARYRPLKGVPMVKLASVLMAALALAGCEQKKSPELTPVEKASQIAKKLGLPTRPDPDRKAPLLTADRLERYVAFQASKTNLNAIPFAEQDAFIQKRGFAGMNEYSLVNLRVSLCIFALQAKVTGEKVENECPPADLAAVKAAKAKLVTCGAAPAGNW
jgi:hypothetical protein